MLNRADSTLTHAQVWSNGLSTATIGLGAGGTLNFVQAPLEPYYGSKHPTGTFIFMRLRAFHLSRSTMRVNDMSGMQMRHDLD